MATGEEEFISTTVIQPLFLKIALEAPEEKVPVISATLITPALPSCFMLLCLPVLFSTSLARTEELFYCQSFMLSRGLDTVCRVNILSSLIQGKEHNNQLEAKQMSL